MSDNYPQLPVGRTAAGAITKRRWLATNANDGELVQASAASDKLMAVSGGTDAVLGDTIDAHFGGIVPIEYGGVVAPGDPLTSDANGKAVVAATTNRIGGFATLGGGDGTIGAVRIAPGVMP